ncbi:TetR/AcrR family transcriptional regulator [Ferrovibrio sp.]|uniref:TetR/AcrR family transcriptional regulator n=1 Tax=Ferrovibrio sp. TaxID=1917215 RepID=UPI003D0F1975
MARPKSFDTEDALLRAMDLFWRQGFHNTGMTQLVQVMGVSRQSLYDTYGDKTRLFMAALERYCATLEAQLLAPLKAPDAGLVALHQAGLALIDFLLAFPERRACLMVNSAMELAPHDAAVASRAAGHMAAMTEAFRGAIATAQARGEIASMEPADSLARYMTSTANGLIVAAKSGADRAALADILRLAALVLQPRINPDNPVS